MDQGGFARPGYNVEQVAAPEWNIAISILTLIIAHSTLRDLNTFLQELAVLSEAPVIDT